MWMFNTAVGILMVVMYYQAKAKGDNKWQWAFGFLTILNFTFAYLNFFN